MITLENVAHAYERMTVEPVPALRGISLSVGPGAFLGILGAAGSGKTTLLQVMGGLLRPTEGRVIVDEEDPARSVGSRRGAGFRVGLVFQFPERQLFEATVFEDVAYGPRNMGLDREEVENRVRDALDRTGLDPDRFGGRSPTALSFGEMRRVAIAGILSMRPRMLLLDEPTAGLDESGKMQLGDLLEALHEEGVGIVVASHDVTYLAGRVRDLVVLRRGKIAAEGRAIDVLREPGPLAELGVAVPFLSDVLSGLADRGRPVTVESLTYPAVADALVALLEKPDV